MYDHLVRNQARVEESILDVKDLLQLQYAQDEQRWRPEWVEAVQELLERDAGWNWQGFWSCVADNLEVHLSVARLTAGTSCALRAIPVEGKDPEDSLWATGTLLKGTGAFTDSKHLLCPNPSLFYCSIDATT